MAGRDRELLIDRERAELDNVVEKLARSPRLSNLLRYLGDKYLRGESEQLREHNIATDVFGRPGNFDPGQDAIARVEAHRLRKKLKQYYELEGKDRPVQIFIPSGSYVPVFKHLSGGIDPSSPVVEAEPPAEVAAPNLADLLPSIDPSLTDSHLPVSTYPKRLWWYLGIAATAMALIVLVSVRFTHSTNGSSGLAQVEPGSESARASSPGVGAGTPRAAVRLLTGYTGQPHMDPTGAWWEPDKYFDRGGPWRGAVQFTARTNDPFLFQSVRTGEFSYDIPLSPGIYELHLYFVEPAFGPGLGGGELSRTFNVYLNGQPLLPGFDIVADAMGPNIADERVFKDVQPASDGKLHLLFEGVSGKPILCALEILPGTPHKQLPIRLTTQPSVFVDHSGQMWSPDNYYLGGQTSLRQPPVTGTPDPDLFSTERFGHFTYAIPVDTRSRYTVVLHFAEFYFGPQARGLGGIGSRKFNVMCNGVKLLDDFDIFKTAGSLHALTETFHHVKPSPQGKIDLLFEPIANYANVSAIEVLDESQ